MPSDLSGVTGQAQFSQFERKLCKIAGVLGFMYIQSCKASLAKKAWRDRATGYPKYSVHFSKMAIKEKSVGRPAQMKKGRGVQVYLDAPSVKLAQRLGEGNVSEGIRRALRLAAVRVQAARDAAVGSAPNER